MTTDTVKTSVIFVNVFLCVLAVRNTCVAGGVPHSNSHHRSLLRHHHIGHLSEGGPTAARAPGTVDHFEQSTTSL